MIRTISIEQLSGKYIGLGIVTGVFSVLAILLLQYTKRIRGISGFFKSNFTYAKKSPFVTILMTTLYYILLALPIILIIVWVSLLGSDSGASPAIQILLVFLFLSCLMVPVPAAFFYWKVLLVLVLFVVSQLVTLGLSWGKKQNFNNSSLQSSFFALTAIILSINGVLVSISLWFLDGTSWALTDYTSPTNKKLIQESIQIWNQEQSPRIIDGGFYYYVSIRPVLKWIMTVSFYLLSLGALLSYVMVAYRKTNQGTVALLNSFCVIGTDMLMTMILFITKETNFNPITNSTAIIILRIFIVVFTGDLWFLGYCFLYLILGTYLSLLIINKYYPRHQKLPTLTIEKNNIFAMPEVAAILLHILFAGVNYYIARDNGRHLSTVSFNMDGTLYNFWVIGIAFFILLLSIFFYLVSLRIVERSQNRIRSINFYYMGCQWCSQYYFFIFFAYALLVILGFYMYAQTSNTFIWNSNVFLPLFYQALVLFYANWAENDYLLLGSVEEYNKKVKKRRQRMEKMTKLKTSVMKKMKIQGMSQIQIEQNRIGAEQKDNGMGKMAETSNFNLLEGAQIESNFMVEDNQGKTYEEWRNSYGLVQAFRQNKLLPSDKKIIISLIVMAVSLCGYCLVYTLSSKRATAVIISVEIVYLFLTLIPMKRYFCTLERPNLGQIILFVLGILLNYIFGAISYIAEWNTTDLWTIWWTVINIFILSLYAALALLRDKGLSLGTYICCVVSVILLVIAGIILIAAFDSFAVGITIIGVAIYYGYLIGLYIVYLWQNKSLPQFMHYITVFIVVATCFAVMIFGFVSQSFNDFLGFSITYLVINLLILAYGGYSLYMSISGRFDRPNFFSPYGTPVFRYDTSVHSVKTNITPVNFWMGGWLMFYGYCLMMEIFLDDVNAGNALTCLFFIVFTLTFIYFVTYNVHKAGKIKQSITQKLIQDSWNQVLQVKKNSGETDVNMKILRQELQKYKILQQNKMIPSMNKQDQTIQKHQNSQKDIDLIIHNLEEKIEKDTQNQQIALVNLWVKIMLKCQSVRKKKMLRFINFIKEDGQLLAEIGVAIVVDDGLYDIESAYNQVFQEYNMLSPLQKIQFDKKLRQYVQRKNKIQNQNEELNRKQQQCQRQREQELKKKLQNQEVDDSDKPLQQMRDSPLKMKKMLQNLRQPFTDVSFEAGSKYIPQMARSQCKQWTRPPADSVLVNDNTAMSVRQGYLGDCYLISAIGVLDSKTIKKILGVGEWKNAEGSFMVKFRKYGKDIYIIIDSRFPSSGGDEWLFGRCEDKKQIFTNILQKAYAKLYGGYQNIVGGKVSLALSDMTGGFPQEIKLKKYQDENMDEVFDMMISFKKSGYLMGAGSPQNPQGDAVDIDGIVQGHAYLVMDVRNLDGNKIIKLRNPHGIGGRQSTLDWSDNSPKWTKRLLNLANQQMKDDGAFWMGLQDFVYCYRALYVCRIFDESIWKRMGPYSGQWKGESAAGLPTKKCPTAIIANNPHYGIKVSKKATLFVELVQSETDEQRRGKNYIFFMVQKNNGERISSNSANKLCGTSGSPINSVSVSGQIELKAQSYPYIFSLMVSAYEKGCEGTYQLNLYCDDQSAQIIEDDSFDK